VVLSNSSRDFPFYTKTSHKSRSPEKLVRQWVEHAKNCLAVYHSLLGFLFQKSKSGEKDPRVYL
jgi:hypothetical protein